MPEARREEFMDCFYVIANELKEYAIKESVFIKNYLEDRHKVCYLHKCGGNDLNERGQYTDASSIPEDVECVIAIGGDGTLLHASRDIVGTGLPILGINMGTLGYLADIDVANVEDALDRLIADRFYIEDRMMLRGCVEKQDHSTVEDIALNDIVLSRRGKLRVVDFNIYVDETFLCSYRADGIIVSTPTGSTGYTLSAGGPIVSPDASLILLTALAPHTLASRTIVLPDHVKVTIEISAEEGHRDGKAELLFDGNALSTMGCGERVTISKTEQKTHLIKMDHKSFVTNLREKLR